MINPFKQDYCHCNKKLCHFIFTYAITPQVLSSFQQNGRQLLTTGSDRRSLLITADNMCSVTTVVLC